MRNIPLRQFRQNTVVQKELFSSSFDAESDARIELWYLPFADFAGKEAWYLARLDAVERMRYRQCRNVEEARRFATARACVREILSARLGCRPSQLHFTYGPYGKPHCAPLSFSLARTTAAALIAVGQEAWLGVDLEQCSMVSRSEELRAFLRYVHPEERKQVTALPRDEQPMALLRLWLRKEAVAKALGESLLLHFSRVLCSPDAKETEVCFLDERSTAASFWNCPLLTCPGHVGAVAFPKSQRARRMLWRTFEA